MPSTEPAVHSPPLASSCAAQQPCGAQLSADAETAQRVSVEAWPAQTCLPAPAAPAEPLLGQAPPVCRQRPLGQASACQHGHMSAAYQAICEPRAAHPDPSRGGLPAVLFGPHAHASRCGCGWWAVHLTCAAWGQALPPAADETTQTPFQVCCVEMSWSQGEEGGMPACGNSGSSIQRASAEPLRDTQGAGLGSTPAEGRQMHSAEVQQPDRPSTAAAHLDITSIFAI